MKRISFLFVLLISFSIHGQSENDALKEIQDFREIQNTQFRSEDKSPLTDEDRKSFEQLDFYDIDLNYRVIAKLVLTPDAPVFEMKTTTDRLPLYRKYAVATFEIDGIVYSLSLYQNQRYMTSPEYDNTLFLPFSDATNGAESYGGGRYMDVKIPADGVQTVVLDFNQTYNPYCAYNKKYSCPIPPLENNLKIGIYAGIKAYDKH